MATIIIEPGRSEGNYWRDLWRYRELLFVLAWRDVSVRYKQTVIGVAWALLRPAMIMLAFVFFRRMAGLHDGQVPEPMLVFAAVLPWQFFSSAVLDCASSLIGNSHLISKVYFPRLIVPCASVAASFADFLVSAALLVAMMLWYGCAPGWRFLFLPAFAMLLFALALGLGLLLASLTVKYRDLRHVAPFFVQFGVFVSPVGFVTSDVPAQWRLLYALNPLVGAIDGFRWAIIGPLVALDWRAIVFSIIVTTASLLTGVYLFRRTESQFADMI